jgi:peptidoglycan/LPS O-acetylase OafA/YrhL
MTTTLPRARVPAPEQDGVSELTLGLLLVTLSILITREPAVIGAWVAFFVVLGPALVVWVRRKITYPRTGGQTRAPSPPGMRMILGYLAASLALTALAIAVTGSLTDPAGWRRWSALFAGLVVAGAWLAAARRSDLNRHRFLALASAAAGFDWALFGQGTDYAAVAGYLATMGGISLIFGLVGVLVFIIRHPVIDDSLG